MNTACTIFIQVPPGLKIKIKNRDFSMLSTLQRGQLISYKNSMQNIYFEIKLTLINK